MHRHPTPGIAGSKPRLPGTKSNGKPASKAEVQRLSREYLEIRNRQMRAKAFLAEISAAVRRNELIEKSLVERQAAYLLIAMRQKILNLPTTYARRLVGLNDIRAVSEILKGAAHSMP
jgi:hypothetical protein